MSGKGSVVLVGASPFGCRALARLGLDLVLVCDPAEDVAAAAAHPVRVHRVPYRTDPRTLLDLPRPEDVRAVMSFTELGLLPAARLAAQWATGGVPVAAALLSRNKVLMRQALAQAGRPVAAGPLRQVKDVGRRHYPVVVKPISGVAGVGVRLALAPHDVEAALATATEPMMWEAYLAGRELSVETVTVEGRHLVLGITEKLTSGPPHFVERGHLVPAALPPKAADEVVSCVTACLDGIGLTVGPAHTEVLLGPTGAAVVETHTRPGGGRIPLVTELVTGLDQYELAWRAVCGLPLPAPAPPSGAAGVRFLTGAPGVLTAVAGVERARALDGVVEVALEVSPGDVLHGWRDNLDRPGFVVCRGRDRDEVDRRLDQAAGAVVFETRVEDSRTAAEYESTHP